MCRFDKLYRPCFRAVACNGSVFERSWLRGTGTGWLVGSLPLERVRRVEFTFSGVLRGHAGFTFMETFLLILPRHLLWSDIISGGFDVSPVGEC